MSGVRHLGKRQPIMLAGILADILAFAAARPTAMMLATARAYGRLISPCVDVAAGIFHEHEIARAAAKYG